MPVPDVTEWYPEGPCSCDRRHCQYQEMGHWLCHGCGDHHRKPVAPAGYRCPVDLMEEAAARADAEGRFFYEVELLVLHTHTWVPTSECLTSDPPQYRARCECGAELWRSGSNSVITVSQG